MGDRVRVTEANGNSDVFDQVIFATHSDTTRDLLDERYEDTRFLLGSVRYRANDIYLHRDPSLMPKRKAAWASWNVLKQEGPEICLTYWMNRLQNLPKDKPLFVTLNPETPPAEELTFTRMSKAHPQFDAPAEAAVRSLKRQQGRGYIWLAGAWMGSGFHEDGLKAGLACALALGGQVPWDTATVETYTPMTGGAEPAKVALGAV